MRMCCHSHMVILAMECVLNHTYIQLMYIHYRLAQHPASLERWVDGG